MWGSVSYHPVTGKKRDKQLDTKHIRAQIHSNAGDHRALPLERQAHMELSLRSPGINKPTSGIENSNPGKTSPYGTQSLFHPGSTRSLRKQNQPMREATRTLTLESPGIIKNSAQAGLPSISSSAFVQQEETKQCASSTREKNNMKNMQRKGKQTMREQHRDRAKQAIKPIRHNFMKKKQGVEGGKAF